MRVQRAFAFIDLSGFTALTESQGDERAVSLLTVFRATVRAICSRRAVRIAKWLGDGAMLVSTDAKPLVAAALETAFAAENETEPIVVKCGIAHGSVILLEGDDYIGHAVNVAARLCELADGHEVLAVADMIGDVPPWGTVEAADEVSIRGLEQPIAIVRLGLHRPGRGTIRDPVCRIPLTPDTAFARHGDIDGATLLFCSDSCLETWLERPTGSAREEPGSVREAWMR